MTCHNVAIYVLEGVVQELEGVEMYIYTVCMSPERWGGGWNNDD